MSDNPDLGDIIQIKAKNKLLAVLRQFSPNLKCISPFDIEDVAEAFATIVEVSEIPYKLNGEDIPVFVLMLENGSDVTLPGNAFEIVEKGSVILEGAEHPLASPDYVDPAQARKAQALMIQHLAAESIQTAFRRYKACKADIKVRRVTSSQKLVENMAAETITKNLKRVVSKSKLSRGNSLRSLHSQQSSESLLTANASSTKNVDPITSEKSSKVSASVPPTMTPSTPLRPPAPVVQVSQTKPSSQSSGIAAVVSSIKLSPRVIPRLDDERSVVLFVPSLTATDLGNVCWQGVNDVYLVISVIIYELKSTNKVRRSWKYRTDTMYGAGAKADFPDENLLIPVQTEEGVESDAILLVEAYHQGLAIEDKQIGVSVDISLAKKFEIPSTGHFPSALIGTTKELNVELFDGIGIKKKSRGFVKFSCTLKRALPTNGLGVTVTTPTQIPDAVSIASGSIGVLEYVTKITSAEKTLKKDPKSSGGLSTSSLKAAMNTLNLSENKQSNNSNNSSSQKANKLYAALDANKESKTKQSRDDNNISKTLPKAPEPPLDSRRNSNSSHQRPASARTESSYKSQHDRSNNSNNNSSNKIPLASGSYDEAGSYLTGPSHQSSYISESISEDGPKRSTLRSSTTSQQSRHRIAIDKTKEEAPEQITPTQSSQVHSSDYKAVDEAFRLAFKQECAIVKVTIKELSLVLDALGYKVHATDPNSSYGGPSGLKYSGAHSSYSIASASSTGSINSRALIELPILHATTLASTISTIVRDRALLQYDSSVVSSGFEMSKHKADVAMNHLSTLIEGPFTRIREYILFTCSGEVGKNAIKESNSSKNEKKYCRPSLWSEQQVGRLLNLLRIPQDSFNGVDGATFLSIDKLFVGQTHDIKASLLRARFTVYQQLLNFLESWWDVGIRPEDLWNESSVKRKNSLKQPDAFKSSDKSKKKTDINALLANKDQVFEIAEFETLQQQMISLNRAFGWGLGLDIIALYSSGVERLKGIVAPTLKQNTRIAMKQNQEKLSPKHDINKLGNVSSAGQWIELNIKESDHSWSSLHSLLESSPLYGNILRLVDNHWHAFIPNTCLSAAKTSGSNKFPTTLQKDEFHVGMFVRITHSEALNRTCERFDWWDRPPVEILEQMAKCIGEVVSVNELDSKQRVGIRVLQSNVCDALPIEALVGPCTPEEVENVLNPELEGVEVSHRRSSVNKSKRRKSISKPTASSTRPPPPPASDDPFKAVAESKIRIQHMVKKLKRQYQEEAAADLKKAKKAAPTNAVVVDAPPVAATKIQPVQKDLPPPRMVPNNWMDAPVANVDVPDLPMAGDESAPPPPLEDEDNIPDSPPRGSDVRVFSGKNPWDGGSPTREEIKVDYSWLKPVKKTDTVVAPLEVEVEVVNSGRKVDAAPVGISAVHITQATFDATNAQYKDGINNGKPAIDVTPERVRAAGMKGVRPKSASGHRKPAVLNEDEGHQTPLGPDSFGVSGIGYGADGKQRLTEMNQKWVTDATEELKSPIKSPTKSNKKDGKTHLMRNKEMLAGYFEYSARTNVDVPPVAVGGDDHFLFNPPSPEPVPPRKVEKIASLPQSAKKNRGVNNRYTANVLSQSVEPPSDTEDVDRVRPRPLSEYIAEDVAEIKDNPPQSPVQPVDRPKTVEKRKGKSPREDVYRHRETARSQKEADYKENSIMKELKKLGVKNPW